MTNVLSHAISTNDDVWQMAERLVGKPITALTHAASGGNSRIYRVEADEAVFALKYYPPAAPAGRDRLGVEIASLKFMGEHGIAGVPRVHGHAERFALYDWLDGQLPKDIALADVDGACDFIAHLPRLSRADGASNFPLAAEACLSLAELIRQITRRVDRLREVAETEPHLQQFLAGPFASAWQQRIEAANAAYANAQSELSESKRCLIPADFGFHNILKKAGGTLAFIDFEYFGWDDPVKLVADALLHPGHALSAVCLERLSQRLSQVFAADELFPTRLQAFLPLFSLRWALILCNEFLPEKRSNRAFAAVVEQSDDAAWASKKQVQLAKAEAMLSHPALALVAGQNKTRESAA